MDQLYTLKYVSEKTQIPQRTLEKWVYLRKIPFVKCGRNTRIRENDLQDWIIRNTIRPLTD